MSSDTRVVTTYTNPVMDSGSIEVTNTQAMADTASSGYVSSATGEEERATPQSVRTSGEASFSGGDKTSIASTGCVDQFADEFVSSVLEDVHTDLEIRLGEWRQ